MLVDNSWIFRVPKNIPNRHFGGGGQNVDERMNIFSKVIWSDAILQKRFGRYLCTYRYIGTLIPEQSAFFSFFFLSQYKICVGVARSFHDADNQHF